VGCLPTKNGIRRVSEAERVNVTRAKA